MTTEETLEKRKQFTKFNDSHASLNKYVQNIRDSLPEGKNKSYETYAISWRDTNLLITEIVKRMSDDLVLTIWPGLKEDEEFEIERDNKIVGKRKKTPDDKRDDIVNSIMTSWDKVGSAIITKKSSKQIDELNEKFLNHLRNFDESVQSSKPVEIDDEK